ncbi:MAG: hypothetical protein CV087_10745 [Candidatus Brocadia sp. WS118]|nr:MAG: hypothetical protein CV087_10745 [Candidatus Brocadia sp. WS118]
MITVTEIELLKAEQQITGFAHGRDGYSLIDLIKAMGLTLEEWKELKNYALPLLDDDIKAVDKYFGI